MVLSVSFLTVKGSSESFMSIFWQLSQGILFQAWFLDETKTENEKPHFDQARDLSKSSPEPGKIQFKVLLWSGASDSNLICLPVRKDTM